MPVRLIDLAVFALWLATMATLWARDVWPLWTTGEPPALVAPAAVPAAPQWSQYGIFDNAGQRIGTTWVHYVPGAQTLLETTHYLIIRPLPEPILIETEQGYVADLYAGRLSEFHIKILGAPVLIRIDGERVGGEFACEVQIGPVRRALRLDAALAGLLADRIQPFGRLPGLRVGRSWRVSVVDPLSLILARRLATRTVVARVTARDLLSVGRQRVPAFRVETDDLVCWVDPAGEVLRSEVSLPPPLGRLRIVREPYNQEWRNEIRERFIVQTGRRSLWL